MDQAPPLRVLLGNLEPIMVVGLRTVLEEEGIEVVGQEREPRRIVSEVERLQPESSCSTSTTMVREPSASRSRRRRPE